MTSYYNDVAKRVLACAGLVAALVLMMPIAVGAEEQVPARGVNAPARRGPTFGVQGFGAVGLSFPVASESLTTVGLDERPQEFGGGVQVTNLWRGLFVQVAGSRWTGDGSRVFVDSRGTRFDLGIPLRVKTTHVDVGAGWRFQSRSAAGHTGRVVPYAGGGVGLVDYSETSSLAEAGENPAERATTYSAFGGVEVRLTSWLGVAADARYRYVKGILGTDGVSEALGDDSLSAPSASVRLVLGWFGSSKPATRAPEGTPVRQPARPAQASPRELSEAETPASTDRVAPRQRVLAIVDTPVRIAPDRAREPLTVLERGAQVIVLGEEAGWLRIEFRDQRWGTRVGYVEQAHVRIVGRP